MKLWHPPRVEFISLKWKALLLTSLILVSVVGLISYRSYLNLTEQFERQRADAYRQRTQQIQSFIAQSQENLIRLASVLPHLPGLEEGLLTGNGSLIHQAFDPQWPILQLDWSLDQVAFFDNRGRTLAHWQGASWSPEQENPAILAHIRTAGREERPVSGVSCDALCQVYVAVPILTSGHHAGVVLSKSALADALRYLREQSGHEVALLIGDNGPLPTARYLPHWQTRVAALTAPERTFPVLAAAEREHPHLPNQGIEVSLEGRVHQVLLMPVNGVAGNPGFFVIIADITQALSAITRATREIILVGGVGWLLAECLLLLTLWAPLSRLRLTADALPLLARSEYQRFRSASSHRQGRLILADEIDHLNLTAVALADRLEQLEGTVVTYTHSLSLHIKELAGAESRLAWLSDHDSLTGLLNRRRFQEELALALRESQHQAHIGALLVIDLDQFKFINDTAGHQSGDMLLIAVGRLLSTLPSAPITARLGGDEFALLMTNGSAEDARGLARDIRDRILATTVPMEDQKTLRVSASIGIVMFPEHAKTSADLIACANLAVYQAKEVQPGSWYVYSGEDQTRERMRHRVFWKDRLADALDNDRFELHFQPILDLHNDTVSHYEVLIRLRDAQGQMVPPGQFIDAAERSGMIHALDRHVVSKALAQLARLRALNQDLSLSINLSGHAFSDPDLLTHIRRELERQQIPPQRIIFEITETAAVSDFNVASSLMLSVKALGCAFALDDFGIGFSSFYYLKHLPVDYLKIDGSFIRQLADNHDDQIIVQAIAGVARGFGKKIIAEYVESESILPLLRKYGVDFAQGYLVGRPQPAELAFPVLGGNKVVPLPGVGQR